MGKIIGIDLLNMFLLILKEYHGFDTNYSPPTEIPSFYIAHPRAEKIFTSIEDYLKWYDLPYWMKTNGPRKSKRPLIGILFYNDRYQNDDSRDLAMVIDKLERQGIGVIPAMSSGAENFSSMKKFFMNNGTPCVDAVVSFLYFRIEGGPLGGNYEAFEAFCKQLNIPLINYLCMGFSTLEDWRERSEGLYPMETNLCIIMPELDALIEGVSMVIRCDLRKDFIRADIAIMSLDGKIQAHVRFAQRLRQVGVGWPSIEGAQVTEMIAQAHAPPLSRR